MALFSILYRISKFQILWKFVKLFYTSVLNDAFSTTPQWFLVLQCCVLSILFKSKFTSLKNQQYVELICVHMKCSNCCFISTIQLKIFNRTSIFIILLSEFKFMFHINLIILSVHVHLVDCFNT